MLRFNVLNHINAFKTSTKFSNSFMMNLFACNWNLDYIDYPELQSEREVEKANEVFRSCQSMLSVGGDNVVRQMASTVLPQTDCMKKLQLCRVAEALGCDPRTSVAAIIPHLVVCELLGTFGSEEQHRRLLEPLQRGERVARIGLVDGHSNFQLPDTDDSTILLLVFNHGDSQWSADLKPLLVDRRLEPQDPTAFSDHAPFTAVAAAPSESALHRLLQVPTAILGCPATANTVLESSVVLHHMLESSLCCGLQKLLLKQATEFAQSRLVFGVPLHSFDHANVIMTRLGNDVFASESATYFLAGNLDEGFFWESLATKIQCFENAEESLRTLTELEGYKGLTIDSFEMELRDFYLEWQETMVTPVSCLKLELARSCLDHCLRPSGSGSGTVLDPGLVLGQKLGLSAGIRTHSLSAPGQRLSLAHFLSPHLTQMTHRTVFIYRDILDHLGLVATQHGLETLLEDGPLLDRVGDMLVDYWSGIPVASRCNRTICLNLDTYKHVDNQTSQYLFRVFDHMGIHKAVISNYLTNKYPAAVPSFSSRLKNRRSSKAPSIPQEDKSNMILSYPFPHPHFV